MASGSADVEPSGPSAGLAPYVSRTAVDWPDGRPGHQRLEGSLVSADLSGFTALTEGLADLGREGAEELTALINQRFAQMIDQVDRRGGDVIAFGGDALLCLFRDDGHGPRSVAAALEMRAAMDEPVVLSGGGTVELGISVGIHVGEHDLLLVDAGKHLALFAVGPGATATVEAEAAAGRNEILVSGSSDLRGLDDVEGEPRGAHFLVRGLRTWPARTEPSAPSWDDDRLAAYLPPSQIERLEGGAGQDGEHRVASMLFVQFSGTDDLLAREGPAACHAAVERIAEAVAEVADLEGVHWLGADVYPDGGKFLLSAGVPRGSDDDETAALLAAHALSTRSLPLPLRIGVNRGAVFAGDLGGRSRRAYTVMGDDVNLAARLMSRAEPGQVVAHASVLARATHVFEHERLEAFLVKGKTAAIEASILGAPTGERRQPRRRAPAFVGRGEQVATLRASIALVQRGVGNVVTVTGEPGSGKTRLLDRMVAGIEGEFALLRGRGDPHRSSVPYRLVRDPLRTAVGILPTASPVDGGSHLLRVLERQRPDLLPMAPLLSAALDVSVPETVESRRVQLEFAGGLIHDLVLDLLRTVLVGPTVWVLDDVEHADAASTQLIDHLLRATDQLPWLFVLGGGAAVTVRGEHLELEPLDDEAARSLVRDAARVPLTVQQVEHVVARANGNPFYAVELTDAIASGIDVPDTLEATILARVDRLSTEDRRWLGDAAVLGQSFPMSLLAKVRDRLEPTVRTPEWAHLNDFLSIRGDEGAFRQAMFHRVVYENVSFRRRRAVHGAAGALLEQARAPAHELSRHFSNARVADRAWKYSVIAAEHSLANYDIHDAVELYQRALGHSRDFAGLDPSEVGRVAETLGDVAELAGEFAAARSAYLRAREAFGRNLIAEARLQRRLGELDERVGKYVAALRRYGRILGRIEREAGSLAPALRAGLLVAYAGVRYRQGRYPEATALLEQAAIDARLAGDGRTLAHAYYLRDVCDTYQGVESDWASRALPLFRAAGDLIYEAHTLNQLGVAAYFHGDWDAAVEHYRVAVDAYGEVGELRSQAITRGNLGEILSDQMVLDEAESLFVEAATTFEALGYRLGELVTRGNLARLRLRQGRIDEAADELGSVLAGFDALSSDYYVGVTRLRLAEVEAERGHLEAAAEAAREVLAMRSLDTPTRIASSRLVALAAHGAQGGDAGLDELRALIRDHEGEYEAELTRICLSRLNERVRAGDLPWAALDAIGVRRTVVIPGLRSAAQRARQLATNRA